MSTSPKHNDARLGQQQRERLEAERRRHANEEALQRREAAERERNRRLDELRTRAVADAQAVERRVQGRTGELYPDDARRLGERSGQLLVSLRQAGTEGRLLSQAQLGPQILVDLNEAADRKRQDDEERQRLAEMDRLLAGLAAGERRLAEIPKDDALKFDDQGDVLVRQAFATAHKAVSKGIAADARELVAAADRAVQRHIDKVGKRRAEWARHKADAEKLAGDLAALLEGLRADPVVVRWGNQTITDLADASDAGERALAAEQFDLLRDLLADAERKARACIESANAAQLKADQRDYIAQSIASVLHEMGFEVGSPQPEHGGHPATAMQVRAADYTGRAIGVSIPFEGEVWYDVSGYPKRVETLADGSSGRSCDEAEAVLNAMRRALNDAFGVETTEVTWEGKPEPQLRHHEADELPGLDGNAVSGSRR